MPRVRAAPCRGVRERTTHTTACPAIRLLPDGNGRLFLVDHGGHAGPSQRRKPRRHDTRIDQQHLHPAADQPGEFIRQPPHGAGSTTPPGATTALPTLTTTR